MKSLLLAVAVVPLGLAGLPADAEPRDVTLVVYDSFPDEGTAHRRPAIASPKTPASTSNCSSPATPARWSPRRCSPPATRKAT